MMKVWRLARYKKRGFTLIELILMIAVGSILLLGISSAAQLQVKATTDNRDFLIALHLAKRQMAIMNKGAYPAVASEAALTADAAFPDFIPTREVVSVDTSGSFSLREIRIRIRKGSSSGPVLITLYTYRSDLLTFGNGI